MEGSSEYFYVKMKESETPGRVLADMYCSIYGINSTKKEVIMCNKLIGFFGRSIVFFSIIDMGGTYQEQQENPYPLLYTICKKRFENSHSEDTLQSRKPLDDYITNIKKEIERIKKQKPKIPPAEGLNKNGR